MTRMPAMKISSWPARAPACRHVLWIMPLLCVIDTKAFAGLVFIGPFCNEIVRAFSLTVILAMQKKEKKKKKIFNTHVVSRTIYCSNLHTAEIWGQKTKIKIYFILGILYFKKKSVYTMKAVQNESRTTQKKSKPFQIQQSSILFFKNR